MEGDMIDIDKLKSAIEWVNMEIDTLETYLIDDDWSIHNGDRAKYAISAFKTLVELTKSVLKVEGLPAKKEIYPREDLDEQVSKNGYNQAHDDFTLVVAKHYVRKDKINKLIEDWEKSAEFLNGDFDRDTDRARGRTFQECADDLKLITGEG
jgi:hypothetical protein